MSAVLKLCFVNVFVTSHEDMIRAQLSFRQKVGYILVFVHC